MLSPAAILVVSRQRVWTWQTILLLQVALPLDGPRTRAFHFSSASSSPPFYVPCTALPASSSPMMRRIFCLAESRVLSSAFKLRQPGVGTPRRQRHSCSHVLFAGTSSSSNRQDRDIRQHDAAVFVTSFAATSGPALKYGQNGLLNTPFEDASWTP
uniref:Putative secreted protein n=1 Tax=Ixodes ricinus TaxID=34613 RepID=A0A147BER4_IXORI